MSTVSKLFPEQNAFHLESILIELVQTMNDRHLAILDQYRVGELEVDIIRYLTEHEQKKMKEVGEYFNIKLSTLTSTIDKLEKNKLVKRKNSKDDRRVIFIQPTAKGRTLLDDLKSPAKEATNQLMRELKPADFEVFIQANARLLDLLKG